MTEEKIQVKESRKRKKKLYNTIREQMEFYFSDSNLQKDKFLNNLLSQEEDGYIDLSIFLTFNKIRKLTTDINEIVKALSSSEILQVNPEKTKVRRMTEIKTIDNVDDMTIYVENLFPTADHEDVKNYFSSFGQVTFVKLFRHKPEGQNKGFAFVEFSTPDAAKRACEHFSMLQPENTKFTYQTMVETSIRKRNLEEEQDDKDECPIPQKKMKIEAAEINELQGTDNRNLVEIVEAKKKKKTKRQRHKTPKDKSIGSSNLVVLSKAQWKALRNKYKSVQKTNMIELKRSLGLSTQQKQSSKNAKWEKSSEMWKKSTKEEEEEETWEDGNNKANESEMDFLPGVLIKLTVSKPIHNVKEFKDKIQNVTKVAYIDVSDQNDCYIRCFSSDDAKKLLEEEILCKMGSVCLLEGSDESVYWEKIQRDRETKRTTKLRQKVRGREKIIMHAENQIKKRIHVIFTD